MTVSRSQLKVLGTLLLFASIYTCQLSAECHSTHFWVWIVKVFWSQNCPGEITNFSPFFSCVPHTAQLWMFGFGLYVSGKKQSQSCQMPKITQCPSSNSLSSTKRGETMTSKSRAFSCFSNPVCGCALNNKMWDWPLALFFHTLASWDFPLYKSAQKMF